MSHPINDEQRERDAAQRLSAALETICDDLEWHWHWGDGEGGYVLDKFADMVRARGYSWPGDSETAKKPYAKERIPRSLAKRVFERDGYRCVECQSHIDLTCDHIIAESKGGPTTFENLQTMCRPCNSRKGIR